MAEANTVKKPSELTPKQRWAAEIEHAEKENKKFYERGEGANRRYLDERDTGDVDAKKFNIFYANTNILQSALYTQVPQPMVSRRYTDYRDQVGRVAALVLERALGVDLNDPSDTFDDTMRQAVQDRLVPGLGTAWLRLETETEDIPESEGGQLTDDAQSTQPSDDDSSAVPAAEGDDPPANTIPLKKIKEQRVAVDYVYWRDFLWSPCRVYSERRWVARKVYMTYEQLEKRFGKEKAKLTSLNYNSRNKNQATGVNSTTPKDEFIEKAIVYEIWDRVKRQVVWYTEGYSDLLDTKDDFLNLESFEPCPAPMMANVTTSNTVPRPDYFMIQDQYIELDTVNARISLLVSACKVVGIYARNSAEIQALFQGAENKMIPVDNWAQFSEKGGVKGSVDWIPLDQVVATLQRLYESREAIKGQIYELTGIADIVRGDSKASETLGAQQIKAQFASIRIKRLQNEVARFATDILRIKAEIMVKHFDIDILIRKSGIVYTDNDEYVAPAIALLKSEEGFQWRIAIQSDSMAQADYDSEKKDRIEFMSAVSGYMANALPITVEIPEAKPIILGMLKWGIAAFKKADDIEGMLDKQLSAMEGQPPPPPPPDPKMAAVQAKIQGDQQKAQLDAQSKQQDMSIAQQKAALEAQMLSRKMEFEQGMQQMEMQMKRFELEMNMAQSQQEMQQNAAQGQQELQIQQAKGQQEVQNTGLKMQNEMEMARQQHEQTMQANQAQSEQTLAQGAQAHEQKLGQEKKSGALKLTLAKQAAAQKPAPSKTVH